MNVYLKPLMSLLLLAALAACQPRMAQPVTVAEAEPYTLDTGDQLHVTVFGQDAMAGDYVVDGSGYISLPLIAQVEARGRTSEQLEQQIGQQLVEGGYLKDPNVNVQILTHRPFFILGQVSQPGQFVYMENMTVLAAVAMAGGFTARADPDGFTITRKVGDQIVEERAQRNTVLRPGDVVYVRERIL
jgi:polysaccharide export outer membrane protein